MCIEFCIAYLNEALLCTYVCFVAKALVNFDKQYLYTYLIVLL